MRRGLRIALVGIALVAAVAMLGGCGGGSETVARELHAVLRSECGSGGGADVRLRGLVAGVLATEREFESAGPGNKAQILQSMKENIAAIHRELSPMNDCARNALRRKEGKPPLGPVYAPPRPQNDNVIAHRVGPETLEPGGDEKSASPCGRIGEHGVATVAIVPHWSNCLRVSPGDRLAIADPFEFSPQGGSVQVNVGGWEVWLAPGQRGLIPGRIGSYLGEGSHQMGVAGAAFGTLLIVEPKASGR
jgi:hypothetical protein